jgi:hypothetical protein
MVAGGLEPLRRFAHLGERRQRVVMSVAGENLLRGGGLSFLPSIFLINFPLGQPMS